MLLNRLLKIAGTVLFLTLLSLTASATEYNACVKYQRSDYTWSHGYKITGFMIGGGDLNKATNSYSYSDYNKYFVIPWRKGGYTALRLNSYENTPPSIESQYTDQNGRIWRLQKGWNYCY